MRIGLLGTLAVQDEAGRPVRVGGSRVRALLTLLALEPGRVVPTASLVDGLWEDDPPANAANSLQSLVSRLRAALRQAGLADDLIESHPAGYRLAVPPHEVDAVAFEKLARAGSQALASGDAVAASRALREALDAWRGPALADAAGARFAAGPSARLEELRIRAALDLIEAGLALGESDSLIGELRAMITADPLAERPRGLLMRALAAAGRQAEALAVYTEMRELLAGQLGVDPSAQLEQVYLSVLRQDLRDGQRGRPQPGEPTPGRPGYSSAPRALALPLTSFVGRDDDVARVLKMLTDGRLVTLTGPGGAGKTRLALETATRLAGDGAVRTAGTAVSRQPDQEPEACQLWLVELTPVTDSGEMPYAVLHALGIRDGPVLAPAGPTVPADPAERLMAALERRHGLLILDNCEHVVTAAAALAEQVLARCPDVRVLTTSREPLRIAGETLWPVPPLPVPPAPAEGPDITGYASVRLLTDRAAAVRPGFTVDAANAADVARICRALDGMPLAIELAAARLRTLSAAQLAQRLDARFDLLTGGSRTAVPRHQTLRAVVNWSWELLSGPEQVLARRLAVFPGGATLTAAEEVCQDDALPAEAVLPAVFGLVEKSFLAVDDSGEPRYRMLETIRAYCLERLAEAGEEDRVRQAFATHFLILAETADPLLRGAEQHAWMRRLTAEQDNLHAALRWAIDRRDAARALRFGQALSWFWMLRGQHREDGTMARKILAVSEPAGSAGQAGSSPDVLQARAVCAVTAVNATWDIAEVSQPLADAESLLTAQRPPHPFVIIGVAMLGLYVKRDPERALQALTAHFGSADPWIRPGTRLMHSFFSKSLGRMDGATGMLAEALAGFQAIGDQWGMAVALMGQAELASLEGDHARAVAALEQAAGLSQDLDPADTAQMYASLAKSRSRTGDFAGALADMARAERLAQAQGQSDCDLWISYIRAELAWLRGDLAEASGICRELDGRLASKPTALVGSFRALVLLRAGLAELRTGDAADARAAGGSPAGGSATLADALRLAADGQDRPAVAAVMDALAAASLSASAHQADSGRAGADQADAGRGSAERAAVLLGAAHSVRGAFDHGSLDAPAAADAARRTLGGDAFEAAYQRGRGLSYQQALALAETR